MKYLIILVILFVAYWAMSNQHNYKISPLTVTLEEYPKPQLDIYFAGPREDTVRIYSNLDGNGLHSSLPINLKNCSWDFTGANPKATNGYLELWGRKSPVMPVTPMDIIPRRMRHTQHSYELICRGFNNMGSVEILPGYSDFFIDLEYW